MVVAFVGYYVWDNYMRPVPSVLDKSMAHLEELVRANPGDPDLRVAIADAYLASGDAQRAIGQYSEALKGVEDHKGALLGLGRAHAKLGHHEQAIEHFNRVVEIGMQGDMPRLDQQLEAALFYLGQIHLDLDDPEAAIDALTQAIGLAPTDADAIYLLGRAYQENGDHEEAITRFERAVQFVPDWVEAYQDMAFSYEALGDTAAREYPDGMLALLAGDHDEAIEHLEAAAETDPENANAFWGLGAAYEMVRKSDEALAAYQQALVADPDHVLAQAGAERLGQS